MATAYNGLTKRRLKVLNFLCDEFLKGNKRFISIAEMYSGLDHEIPRIPLRFILLWLLENEYVESMNTGKFSNYYRVFRVNLEPKSAGCEYYVARKNC